LAPRLAPGLRQRAMNAALNRAVIARLQPCDVIIGMSGIYLEALEYAKSRFGARVWLERGSRHILSQDEILAALPGAERPSRSAIDRELAGYALADRIVVPSRHVVENFERYPEARAKLFRNPYGVDLAMFPRRADPRADATFRLLNVGGWSRRKGSDVLAEAVGALAGIRLTHVGDVLDCAFPDSARFIHRPPIKQHKLSDCYAHADAFILASRQDGFGMVLAQALASGLPIICTDRTGGADLAHTPALADRITVTPHGDALALASAISSLRERLEHGPPLAPLAEADVEAISWSAYGRRYQEELLRDLR
ncbi:MAG TPA: glycosyltransferase family 4 protein, partial [Ktedonobacterales bacterium]